MKTKIVFILMILSASILGYDYLYDYEAEFDDDENYLEVGDESWFYFKGYLDKKFYWKMYIDLTLRLDENRDITDYITITDQKAYAGDFDGQKIYYPGDIVCMREGGQNILPRNEMLISIVIDQNEIDIDDKFGIKIWFETKKECKITFAYRATFCRDFNNNGAIDPEDFLEIYPSSSSFDCFQGWPCKYKNLYVRDSEPEPTSQEPEPVFSPKDDDCDGIINSFDQCPNNAENFNNIEDSDGCPEVIDEDQLLAAQSVLLKYEQLDELLTTSYNIAVGSLGVDNRFLTDDFIASLVAQYNMSTKDQMIVFMDFTKSVRDNIPIRFYRAFTAAAFEEITPENNFLSFSALGGTIVSFMWGSCVNYAMCHWTTEDQVFYSDQSDTYIPIKERYCDIAYSASNTGWCIFDVTTTVLIPLVLSKTAIIAKFGSKVDDAFRLVKAIRYAPKYKKLAMTLNKLKPIGTKLDPEMFKLLKNPKFGKVTSKYTDDILNLMETAVKNDNWDDYYEYMSHLISVTDEAQAFRPFIAPGSQKATKVVVYAEQVTDASKVPIDDIILGKYDEEKKIYTMWKKSTMEVSDIPISGKNQFMEIDHLIYRSDPVAKNGKVVIANFVNSGLDNAALLDHNAEQAERFMKIKDVFGDYTYKTVAWNNMQNAEAIVTGLNKRLSSDSVATVEGLEGDNFEITNVRPITTQITIAPITDYPVYNLTGRRIKLCRAAYGQYIIRMPSGRPVKMVGNIEKETIETTGR